MFSCFDHVTDPIELNEGTGYTRWFRNAMVTGHSDCI